MNQLPLRKRIILHFCGFLAVLLMMYSGALIISVEGTLDMVFNRLLADETEVIVTHLEERNTIPTDLPPQITAYLDYDQIPAGIRDYVDREKEDVYELNEEDLDYHVCARRLRDGRMVYVLHDVSQLELAARSEKAMALSLLVLGLVVLVIGCILALFMANWILKPVSKLADGVRRLSLEGDNPSLADYDAPDEIGTLAETIDEQMKSLAAFAQREREFTSHASHELRTPVAVIKGAVEILQSQEAGDGKHLKPLARIERAVGEIEALIDTFLLLARHDKPIPPNAEADLPAIVVSVVNSHRHLLDGKDIEVEIETEKAKPVNAATSVVSIGIANLVRNAFQYTLEGRVRIEAIGNCVSVTDTGPGLNSSAGGSGLGLTIVRRLCERMGWTSEISEVPEGGTHAKIEF